MTAAGWTSGNDAAETYADKAAIEAVRHVLGAHKLTCDEYENLQQDFKDVAQEAYQQGRVAGLREAKENLERLEYRDTRLQTDVEDFYVWIDDQLAQAAQEGRKST